ncbi:endonuclease VII domain-containing protein [Streptomyces sp. IB2014 016-6]|uniref:endonuclease VII domain-containing protein n=1 Tax=Streptomyces sp. IB2014 016-6 TaxID=2517818 RepID=UPI00321FCA9E
MRRGPLPSAPRSEGARGTGESPRTARPCTLSAGWRSRPHGEWERNGTTPAGSAPAAHVDHCHQAGRVRGVLCFNCNSVIGKLGDDPDAQRRATAYLEGNAWKPTLVAPGVYRLPS